MNLTFLGISGGVQSPESGNISFFVTENKTSILVEVSGNPAGELTACGVDPAELAIGANAVIHEAGGVEAEESTLNIQGHCSGRQAALAAGKISLTDQNPPELFPCHLPPAPEKRAAIFSEARFLHPGRTMIPNLFSPYTI